MARQTAEEPLPESIVKALDEHEHRWFLRGKRQQTDTFSSRVALMGTIRAFVAARDAEIAAEARREERARIAATFDATASELEALQKTAPFPPSSQTIGEYRNIARRIERMVRP